MKPDLDADTAAAAREALRRIERRPMSRAEVRRALTSAGYDAAAIEGALERLAAAQQIDDDRLALHYILTRAERLGHGPRRLIDELERRGVARDVAEAAWCRAESVHALNPRDLLQRELRKRLSLLQRATNRRRSLAPMYNALLRAGFDEDAVRAELEALAGPLGSESSEVERDDDLE